MIIRRDGETLQVTEQGHSEDDTNIHEFRVLENLTQDTFERFLAQKGVQPKAHIEFKQSGTRDQIGLEWWESSSPPTHVVAYLEANGYIVKTEDSN